MSDYGKLIEDLKRGFGHWYVEDWSRLVSMYADAAAAIEELQGEVKRLEPKRGEWIDGDGRRVTARCSVCGHLRLGNGAEYANKSVNFCENCGSKMGGQNDEP